MKTVVVSGATGFVGQRLVPMLRTSGYRVFTIQRTTNNQSGGLTDIIPYDGTIGSLQKGLREARPNVAIHLASLFTAAHTPEQVDSLIQTNLGFATQFLEACFGAGVRSFINTGSAWQRFQNSDYRPVNLYAATKEAFEAILVYFRDLGVKTLTIRLGDTYGPRDTRKKLVSLLIEAAVTGNRLEMSGGEQIINLVYIDDVCEGFLRAIELVEDGLLPDSDTFALRGPDSLSIRELVTRVETAAGKKLDVLFGARPYREREVFFPETLTPDLTGWHPRTALNDGLKRLIQEAQGSPASSSELRGV